MHNNLLWKHLAYVCNATFYMLSPLLHVQVQFVAKGKKKAKILKLKFDYAIPVLAIISLHMQQRVFYGLSGFLR